MQPDLLIVGSGPSIDLFDWSGEVCDTMAISSGIMEVPDEEWATHFISLDKPLCFEGWVLKSEYFVKHVPKNKWFERWQKYPKVKGWEYAEADAPNFIEGPIARGPLPRNHSLLMGVQVASQLGYRRMRFVGVDLTDNELQPISEVLQEWWPIAKGHGIWWENASPLSHLQAWMPSAEVMLDVA